MVTSADPAPPVTVPGLIVHVVVPSDDGTLQVSATSELKPPTAASVTLSVMAVPLGMETTGLATVTVKSGGITFTVTGICRLWVIAPPVAWTVTEPVVADAEAFTVSVLVNAVVDAMTTETGFSEQVRPVVPVHEIATVPVYPCNGVTVTVSLVLLPVETVSLPLPEEIWKSGLATVMLTTTELVRAPLVPCRVTVPVAGPSAAPI